MKSLLVAAFGLILSANASNLPAIPAGCAAALKCTPIEYCTADGMISPTTVILSREKSAYRVPLTDCRDLATGTIGKCCRDPYYTDPWPTNQIGKWVPGVFGGNDGRYTEGGKIEDVFIKPKVEAVVGKGEIKIVGEGAILQQGAGQILQQGGGQIVKAGEEIVVAQAEQGQALQYGVGQYEIAGETHEIIKPGEEYTVVEEGQGEIIQQGFGEYIIDGLVTAGYAQKIHRVFLQPYAAEAQCGLLNNQRPFGDRNNLEADFAQYPWQAMILEKTNKSLLCGGVITRPDVVITAAACVDGLAANNVLIKGGEWKLGVDEEPLPFQIVPVQTIIYHPYYESGSYQYDVAILVLSEKLRFNKNIFPICISSAQEALSFEAQGFEALYAGGGGCVVTGWGKEVLQAHRLGSIMHDLNVTLINPVECEAKINKYYPDYVEYYSKDSNLCAQPENPLNNVCSVDIGSALACPTADGHFVLRGIYSWDSGCRLLGNQIGAFFKFDVEWYEWALGLIESRHFAKFNRQRLFAGAEGKIKVEGNALGIKQQEALALKAGGGLVAGQGIVIKTEPKIVTYTTKPEIITYTTKPKIITYTTKPEIITYTTKPKIVTYTTKPEIFTYTTKPKIITYTTKPEIISYTTKPEIFSYTTKPEIISYTTKPEFVSYATKPEIFTYATQPKYTAYATKPEFFSYVSEPKIVTE